MYCNINVSGGGCAFQSSNDWSAASEMLSPAEAEVESLRNEIVKLRNELAEANEERAQAAEYGLAVLEEKQGIQQQYEDLTSLYESTQRELEVTVSVRAMGGLTGCLPCSSRRDGTVVAGQYKVNGPWFSLLVYVSHIRVTGVLGRCVCAYV